MSLTPFGSSSLFDPFVDPLGMFTPFVSGRGGQMTQGRQQGQRRGGGDLMNMGAWDWNSYLSEPLSMSLQEKGDHFEMNVTPSTLNLRPKDLKVEVNGDILTVHGEREIRSGRGTRHVSFSRSIQCPDQVDMNKVQARFTPEGKLHIELAKVQGQGRKEITIGGTEHLKEEESSMDTEQPESSRQEPSASSSGGLLSGVIGSGGEKKDTSATAAGGRGGEKMESSIGGQEARDIPIESGSSGKRS